MLLPGLWSLDDLEDPSTREILADAQSHPERYVLKPQREGGGNNLYGAAAAERLRDPCGLAAYILMQRIQPPINRRACRMLSAAPRASQTRFEHAAPRPSTGACGTSSARCSCEASKCCCAR